MANAVRFDRYGPVDVLKVVEVERPVPGPGQVLVRVKAAGINLGEAKIREGLFRDRWPTTSVQKTSWPSSTVCRVGPGTGGNAMPHSPRARVRANAAPRARDRVKRSVSTSM